MSKKEVLVEGILDRIVKLILKGRTDQAIKSLKGNPEMQKAVKDLDASAQRAKALLDKMGIEHD